LQFQKLSVAYHRLWLPFPYALKALAEAFKALATKLTEARVYQAFAPLLEQVGKIADSDVLSALAEALQPLATKLTEAEAKRALAPLLQQIGKTTNPVALKGLAVALQAVAAKLTDAQAQQALAVATSSLTWAATENEAVDWASAVVALLRSATHQASQNETLGELGDVGGNAPGFVAGGAAWPPRLSTPPAIACARRRSARLEGVSQPDPTGESPVTTAKPPVRYGAI
jgi:hypothetical protein